MSIASQISRLMSAKSAIRTAIQNKGVTVPASTKLDDYADLIASIPAGSSAWTKIAETSITTSTTSTAAITLQTFSTGDSSIWTSDKIVYVRIRDTAGKRTGYFYGTDNIMFNIQPVNGASATSTSAGMIKTIYAVDSSGLYVVNTQSTSSGYGVYVYSIYSDGRIALRGRYNASFSRTIDGTYSVEVYLLTPPSAIFE